MSQTPLSSLVAREPNLDGRHAQRARSSQSPSRHSLRSLAERVLPRRRAPSAPVPPHAVTIRLAVDADRLALERLALLEGRSLKTESLLVADVDGVVHAALGLASGTRVTNPFVATAGLVRLLELRASQLAGEPVRPASPKHRFSLV